ncbi:MAG TPA: glycosyltransferase family 39 protein [Candidatus Baltobacteraceae bacterium]|nr:glycosyltransferase family 39 protein [Candidatus Baltobacteraceae bacterium]
MRTFALVSILVLGAILRLYHLSSVPTELDADEIDLYNSARSIVTTGHDVDGTLLPFLYANTVRNPPIYAAAGYASSLIFGKTPFGLRFPAVLFGLASIVLIFGITLELTRRRAIALLAALMMAVAPIFVQFSRIAWEPASELPFLLAGIYLALRALRERSPRELIGAALLFGLTAYTYMAGWFYAAVLGAPLLVIYANRGRSRAAARVTIGAAILWLIVAAPALWMWFFDPRTSARVHGIATFSSGISPATLAIFARNYLAHFRWSYLAVTGDPISGITWRYLNGFGAFYWWLVPLAALGALASFHYVRVRALLLWLGLWVLAYPLGGALTNEGAPNAPRTLAGAPVFCIMGAIGIVFLFDAAGMLRRRRIIRTARWILGIGLAAAIGISVVRFARFYFTDYVHQNSNAWDSGTRALFETILADQSRYRRVCFLIRPASYELDSYIRFYLAGSRLQTIDDIEDPRCSLPGTMLAIDNDHPMTQPGFRQIARIVDVDGNGFAELYAR